LPTGIPRTRVVRLESYSSTWPEEYQAERARILSAVGERIEGIEHVGSTSIPGMVAKPIIDIAIALPNLDLAESLVPGMAGLGYDYPGDIGLPNQRIFGRDPQIRTYLVHVVISHGVEWQRYLHFRDALREDLALAREYAELKLKLAEEFPTDRERYTRAKGVVIEKALALRSAG
jgi:GrpB-like predicted nucleotidyltransferase (UPF0157 family)